MWIATSALALLLLSCTSTTAGVASVDDDGVVVAVRVIRATPPAEADADVASETAVTDATVDGGANLASPLDPVPGSGLDTAEGRSHMGDLYARAGLIPEAIFEYQKSIEIEPGSAVRHFKLGLAYQSIRQFEDALASYKEAARLEPDSAWAHAAVSIVHAKMGAQEKAFDAYQTVKNLDDQMAEGLLEVITQYGTFHEV